MQHKTSENEVNSASEIFMPATQLLSQLMFSFETISKHPIVFLRLLALIRTNKHHYIIGVLKVRDLNVILSYLKSLWTGCC